MRIGEIYDAIATEMRQQETQSRSAIVGAMTSYCLALKASGLAAPMWSEAALLKGVHSRLESYESEIRKDT